MISSYANCLLRAPTRSPMTDPEFMDAITLAGELHEKAMSEEDQDKANLMDAAEMMILAQLSANDQLKSMIDILRAEIKAREELRQ